MTTNPYCDHLAYRARHDPIDNATWTYKRAKGTLQRPLYLLATSSHRVKLLFVQSD